MNELWKSGKNAKLKNRKLGLKKIATKILNDSGKNCDFD